MGAIRAVSSVGGGCISPAARVEADGGDRFFLKWSEDAPPEGFFLAEADSLALLASREAVRVPAVVDLRRSWLLLEWLEPGRKTDAMMADLGHRLAQLHRPFEGWIGFRSMSNWIGSLPQSNETERDWPTFWRERRLLPQLRLAYRGGHFNTADRADFDSLLGRLDELLAVDEAAASVLHGDLWSGNVHPMATGEAAVVDPAAYLGHREVDLAMADLFGGFGSTFRDAYEEAWPLRPGYEGARRPIYQLYYLLVHVNLFGGGYVAQTLGTLRSVTS